MKPVVSSILALAIAIAPAYSMAAEKHGKAVAAKVKHHKKHVEKCEQADNADKEKTEEKVDKADKAEKKADKSDKAEKDEIAARPTKKERGELVRARHVDGGHRGEPRVDRGVTVIPASMMTRMKKVEPPALPSAEEKSEKPKAAKTSKHAAEKGARKPPKKHDDANDGELTRDEELAELVARIRGKHGKAKDAKIENATCYKDPIEIIRGAEIEKVTLTKCDGSIAPLAVERLSILVRPGSAPRPIAPLEELAKKKGPEIAKGIRRVDPRLVERLQTIIDHFASGGPTKIDVVSGYRPTSQGSMHSSGRAVDFRIEGIDNDKVVSFCKTLDDTGCGFYPNSSFVHVDVRDAGAGHVTWIDASGPGETPRYVSAWPPEAVKEEHKGAIDKASLRSSTIDREEPPEPVDEHPAELPKLPGDARK